jgi:ABC-type sugar transport system ATPase subunit
MVVIRQGKVAGDVPRDQTTPEEVILMMTGEATIGRAKEPKAGAGAQA